MKKTTRDMNLNMRKWLARLACLAIISIFNFSIASAQVTVGGNVFGGGNKASVAHGTTVLIDQTGAEISGDVYGGGALAMVDTAITSERTASPVAFTAATDSILVKIYKGTLLGNVYGGGLGQASPLIEAHVYGPVHISIGDTVRSANQYYSGTTVGSLIGEASFSTAADKGNIFGGNNIAGTPKDTVIVDIWQTAHTAADVVGTYTATSEKTSEEVFADYAKTDAAHATTKFAIQGVYGGGNQSNYIPTSAVHHHGTSVWIHHCENTVKMVYGGGRAAAVGASLNNANTWVTIDGGRIDTLFAGGDGHTLTNPSLEWNASTNPYRPADIYGDVNAYVRGGYYSAVFGASNTSGTITGTKKVVIDKSGPCATNDEVICSIFGGGNRADAIGDVSLTIECGAGYFNEAYGGCNLADVGTSTLWNDGAGTASNVTLTIKGGTFGSVYGGSKGSASKAAHIYGNVILNLEGGTITDAFGGSNIKGNIFGSITVNVEDAAVSPCELDVTNIYGAGNLTAYTPTSSGSYPEVNIKHIKSGNSIRGDVFGGGLGETAVVTSNPVVTIGDATTGHLATISGRVFGGGSEAPVSGDPTVNVYNGTVPTVHGGGLGSTAIVNGNPTVVVNKTPAKDLTLTTVFGGGSAAPVDGNTTVTLTAGTLTTAFGGGNVAGVSGSSTVTLTGCTVTGGLYGGCNEQGSVGDVVMALTGGTVGTDATHRADVFGGGYGSATTTTGNIGITLGNTTVYGDLYGGSALGSVNEEDAGNTTTLTINGGNLHGTLFGGGQGSNEGSGTTATSYGNVLINYNTANTNLTGFYGGANIRGNVKGNIEVNVLANVGASGDGNDVDIFGGGLGEHTSTEGDVTVTVGSLDGTKTPTVFGDIYGGSALGSVNNELTDATTVNFLNGTLHGNIFGGGLGDKASLNDPANGISGHTDIAAAVNGTVTVNISNNTQTEANCHIDLTDASVYGCNNTNGSPQGNVTVNIYKTAHTTTDTYTYRTDNGNGAPTYAIANVFGGGKQADYTPAFDTKEVGSTSAVNDSSTYRATVNIYGCTNTIGNLYGGGDAAAAYGVVTTVPGGRFGRIFGGGNGEVHEANIGRGGTDLTVHGGYIGQLFGGNNTSGTIIGPMRTLVDNTNECQEEITEFFGGSNLADLGTESNPITLETTIGCGTVFTNIYGGCNLADIHGNVILTIEGGTIDTVYAGSKGRAADLANSITAKAANIYGNTTLHIYGGAIGDAFGGSNINGNITGSITVDMDWSQSSCAQKSLTNLYGASNLATYTPTTAGSYPAVTVKHGTVTNDVFGGGKGDANDPTKGVVSSNPVVTIGDNNNEHYAVARNVYGGGYAAAVTGNTTVTYNDAHASSTIAKLFGGGNAAGVTGTADVTLTAGTVSTGLYGGCNEQGTVGGDITIALNGGTVGTNGTTTDVVYGGGYGHNTSTTGDISLTLDGTTVYGNLYGGSALGAVGAAGKTTTIDIESNTLHGNLFGGGMGSGSGNETKATTNGNIQINYNEENTYLAGLYGGANTNGNVVGNIEVNVKDNVGTDADHTIDIFGGGFGEYTATQGNVTVTLGNEDGTKTPTVYGDVYGGSALGQVNDAVADLTTVSVLSGTLHGNTYGGGLGETGVGNVAKGQVNGSVVVNIGANTGTNESPVYTGYATIDGHVYGCNNTNGSPKGNVNVNIYATAHTSGTDEVGDAGYAIDSVFAGGRKADYSPTFNLLKNGHSGDNDSSSYRATVHVYGCENTVKELFGGGDAAAAYGVAAIVDGGHFNRVFGGGNGEVTVANIGEGGTHLQVHGGIINKVFGGSNEQGTISGPMVTTVDNSSGCNENITEFFGGSNLVPISSSLNTTIACGAVITDVYGGCNLADITGDVTLTIEGGTISYVYAGSKGRNNGSADPDDAADITGAVTLNIYGGAIGNAFGGSNINGNITGKITVNMDWSQSECKPKSLNNLYGASNLAAYTPTTSGDYPEVNLIHGTVSQNVYGGGLGASAEVTASPKVTIGDIVNGSVFGGGDAAAVTGSTLLTINSGSVKERIVGGGNAANVTGSTHVVVNGGTHGLGTGADRGLYGGCNTSGSVGGNVVVDILGGTFSNQTIMNTKVPYNIFGGGYGSGTSVAGNVTVNYGADNGTTTASEEPKLYGNLYGGSALGSVNDALSDLTTVNVLNGSFGYYQERIAGRVYQYGGNIFGGGLGEAGALNVAKGQVNGVVHINIGTGTHGQNPNTFRGLADLTSVNVYGCNNTNGSPQGDVYVDIYKTKHTDGSAETADNTAATGSAFAIENVYGGGNLANYNPPENGSAHSPTNGAKTHVFVHGCDNTVRNIYGGGNAADVIGTVLEVEGGRFGDVFGGGNGLVTPANVGEGGSGMKLVSGNYNYNFDGCNRQGEVETKYVPTRADDFYWVCLCGEPAVPCEVVINTWFAGGNEAEIYNGLETTISCADASKYNYVNAYGGSRWAVIYGDVKLTVEGGHIDNLFGGSQGYADWPADIRRYPTQTELDADSVAKKNDPTRELKYPQGLRNFLYGSTEHRNLIGSGGGNVILTVKGGTIGNIYGGCDQNGNIDGTITVTINDAGSACSLAIDNIYGGSNQALYDPEDRTITSPVVNLVNGTVGRDDFPGEIHGCVFGGGKGNSSSADNGVVTCNPSVVMDSTVGKTVKVKNNIYGGGYLAQVYGSTTLDISSGIVGGSVYGGGKGYYRYGNGVEHEIARVKGNTTINFSGGRVTYNIYGGGEIASVGTISNAADTATTAKHSDPASSFALSWPYKFVYAANTGRTNINITGGRVGLSGKDYMGPVNGSGKPYDPSTGNELTEQQIKDARVDNGDVYGGGKGLAVDRYTEAHFANVKETYITINYASTALPSDASDATSTVGCITGALYGGGENGHVNGNTNITLTEGLVGHALYGAGKGTGTYTNTQLKSRVDDADSTSNTSTSIIAGKVFGNTNITMTGGYVKRNIFGGGNRGSVGIGNYAGGPTEYYKPGYGEYSADNDDWTAARASGHTYITITAGTVGSVGTKDGLPYGNVYGGCRGEAASDLRKTPRINYCPEFFLGYANNTHVVIGTEGSATGPTLWGSVYGGGQDGHVRWNTDVKVYSGTIGLEFTDANKTLVGVSEATDPVWAYRGNVFGAGSGIGTYEDWQGNDQYSYSSGSVTHKATTTIYGGTIYRNLYGGGNLATVGPPKMGPLPPPDFDSAAAIVNFYGGTLGSATYGGFIYGSSRGMSSNASPSPFENFAACGYTQVNLGKADGTSTVSVPNSVFGGGEYGQVTYNTEVNMHTGATVLHTLYGGGQGAYVPTTFEDEVSGRIKGNTTVNILGGTLGAVGDSTNIFGGCRSSFVHGNTTVNIGSSVVDGITGDTSVSGAATIYGNVYGANNYHGNVYGDTYVNIYKTAHTTTDEATYTTDDGHGAPTYSIANVFGGGHEADYDADGDTKRAHVHIYTCDNTIGDVFGGGNAAAAYGVVTTIDGGRFDRVFGGGNGEVLAADIGAGGTLTTINAGRIRQLFGGSNMRGSVLGPVQTTLTHIGTCPEEIEEFYSGSNQAPIVGDITTTIACGTETIDVDRIYGGCNQTDVYGSVTFNIEGGVFDYVFGGSRGVTPPVDGTPAQLDAASADIRAFDATHLPAGYPADSIGEGGRVTLNLYGGTITNAFGGSDINGNIEGVITVNVEDRNTGCPLVLTNLYGGSNLAVYTPTDSTSIISPVININHTKNSVVDGILGNVYGGGKGEESTTFYPDGRNQRVNAAKGRCASNPQVNIGDDNPDHHAKIVGTTIRNQANTADSLPLTSGNVYGGGEIAEVNGSTVVNIRDASTDGTYHTLIAGNVFGAGLGQLGDSIAANVQVNATVNMTGGQVKKNVYGGAELASVGHFETLPSGNHDMTHGLITVNITGGHIGADDIDHATEKYANGNVFGAGLGYAGTTSLYGHTHNFSFYNYVGSTAVTIGGTAIVRGSVFGGGENGHVWRNTSVKIKDGEIGTELSSSEEAEEDDGSGLTIYTGNVYGGGRGIDKDANVSEYSLTAGRVFGNTYVEVTGGIIHNNVYGGGSLASVGDTIADDASHDIMGNVIGGDYQLDTLGGSLMKHEGNGYLKGDPITGTGEAHVRILGGRIGHTGHNEGSVFGGGRGMAGDATHTNYYHLAYVHNTQVHIGDTTIKKVNDPTVDSVTRHADVRGSVFGGGANGHVTQNSYVKMTAGVVGGKTATDYTAAELAAHPLPGSADYIVNGSSYYSGIYWEDTITDPWGRIPDHHHTFLGNVYGGGRGVDHNTSLANASHSRYAGRVFGNSKVEISGGVVYHSVYGGGSLASVGDFNGANDNSNISTMTCKQGTGKTVVVVSGGRVGTNGRNNGSVFGASRGMSGGAYNHLSFVNNTDVTVSGTAVVRGCVFGGGEDGHVLDSTLVKIQGGTIGSGKRGDLPWGNEYLGNVYGGGRGVDLTADHRPSSTAGWVRGNTHVLVSGGHIHNNVYGGGSLASVGLDTIGQGYKDVTGKSGRAWVEVTGGRIGILVDATDSSQNLYGSVYGGGRGRAGIGILWGNDWTQYTHVSNTVVRINYGSNPATGGIADVTAAPSSTTNFIAGNVFGGGNNGHVTNATSVTVTRGLIGCSGDQGFGSHEGNVFGGGRGEDTYENLRRNAAGKYCNTSGTEVQIPDSAHAVTVADTHAFLHRKTLDPLHVQKNYVTLGIAVDILRAPSSGQVYGNTNVTINGATKDDVLVRHSVYGGGALASVGTFSFSNDTVVYTDNTGKATVNISGGTVGSETMYNGSESSTPLATNEDIADYYNDNAPNYPDAGHVYGGGMGMADNTYTDFNYVHETDVNITSSNVRIYGSVYGGSANGHVSGNTDVAVSGGTIGTLGVSSWDGHLFGGGEGSGTVTGTPGDEVFTLHPTCGSVGGNTHVSMSSGAIYGSVYGGGRLALTGVDTAGNYTSFEKNNIYDSTHHGLALVEVSGGYIGNSEGLTLEASDFSIGDIFGSGRGDWDYYQSILAGRVANTKITVKNDASLNNNLRVYGAIFGGGEMAGVGWWVVNPGNDDHGTFAGKTGTSRVNVGGTDKVKIGTEIEFDTTYLKRHGDWTVVTAGEIDPDYLDSAADWNVVRIGKLTHSCTGNIIGGSQGDVDLESPAWISLGRSRQTFVDISGSPVIMGNVYGGAEQGVVTENTHVTVSGGTIGTEIPCGFSMVDDDDDPATPKVRVDHHYNFGSVFGGGYGSERWWDTVHVYDDNGDFVRADQVYNDSCLFDGSGNRTHYTSPTMIAGRVYGNTYVEISGGTIRENVYGGGNMASVGYIERNASGEEYLLDSTKWHGGICTVIIKDTVVGALYRADHPDVAAGTILSPSIGKSTDGQLDHTRMSGHVYGAGKGVGNDPDKYFERYCNVDSTSLTVSGGHIYGSTFGGGADCHVLRNASTLIQEGAYIGSKTGADPDDQDAEEYDGCVLGGGRNALNKNHTAGRVQGHTYVKVTGGRIRRTVLGGGAMARVGVDVDGDVHNFMTKRLQKVSGGDSTDVNGDTIPAYDSLWHGSSFVDVSGLAPLTKSSSQFANDIYLRGKTYKEFFEGTTGTDASGNIIVYRTAIGAFDGAVLVDNDYTIGDIFGGGKGDTKDTADTYAGRVMNTHVYVHGTPRIMADIYAGGEMSCVGWYDSTGANTGKYYPNTGYTQVLIEDNPYGGTPYEFSQECIHAGRSWTLIDDNGRLYHTCSGNVYGGGQGYVEEDGTHCHNWVQMGRVRKTKVDISGGRFLGNVFGGGSRGIVKEDCIVNISGGHFGCIIHDATTTRTVDGSRDSSIFKNERYYYGSVFGGGYGNHKRFLHYNDSCFVKGDGTHRGDTLFMVPTEFAGRVYGNTYLTITGGWIMDCVYGGGDMASTGWVERDNATGAFLLDDPAKRHGGVCTVSISGKTIVGPLDDNGHNAYVYGAGRGISNDPDEYSKTFCNVNETHLLIALTTTGAPTVDSAHWTSTTHGGRIWGSLFGGGADCHVLGDVETQLHSGVIGTNGTTSYDGNIFGAGRNYRNTNHTNGRVRGNVKVLMDGGTIQGTIFGGGRLALTGVDVDGRFLRGTGFDVTKHGNVDIQVRGNATIGTSIGDSLLKADQSCGDIFGSGKGDIDNYEDVWAGRVTNTKITVKDSLGLSPRIYGSVFGGGEMASVGWWDDTVHYTTIDTSVVYNTMTGQNDTTITTNDDNVRNMGTGTKYSIIYDSTGHSEINISGGVLVGTSLEYTVAPADNPGDWTIYNATKDTLIHTCTGNVFGACQGDVDITAPRWISMGRSASTEVNISGGKFMGNVFGGTEQGIVTGDSRVNITGGTFGIDAPAIAVTPHSSLHKWYSGDIYAAGYGSDDPAEFNDTTYNDSTAASKLMGLGWSTGLLSGRTFGNSRVDVLGGDIYGSVYGGGSYASVGDDKPMCTNDALPYKDYPVNGVTTVNIGLPGTPATDASQATGSATIHGEVFGANNFKGTPYGNTNVNIYKTAHTTDNTCPTVAATMALEDPTTELTEADVEALPGNGTTDADKAYYALEAVYGGGNRASHEPIADTGTTNVHVYYCEENTIYQLYGGGNAANTKNNHVIVDGGRIYEVFGGGNGAGEGNPGANVMGTATVAANANGVAKTEVKGGLITDVFAGSNSKGNIGTVLLDIEQEGDCDIMVANTYGGGNEADGGGGVINLYCGSHAGNFYGGSRNADLVGDVVLNIYGGTFENVFGGSKGKPAVRWTEGDVLPPGVEIGDIRIPSSPANIRGNVTVNVFGGNIQKLYGGSDICGNITGKITVNIDLDSTYDCSDGLRLDKVYGGGNLAVYFPDDNTINSPEINIINDSCSIVKPATVPSYEGFRVDPVTDKLAKTFGLQTVFGGGYGDGTIHAYYTENDHDGIDTLRGAVYANPVVNIGGIEQKWDPDEGSMGALVADDWRINRVSIRKNVYGGGESAPVKGSTMVTVNSSRITKIAEDNGHYDTTFAIRNHDTTYVVGSIFGGGSGPTATIYGNTTVGIFGDATVVEGNVYGGGEAAVLTGGTDVQVGYERIYVSHLPRYTVTNDPDHTGKRRVEIYSATPGATIYYTLDGSDPTVDTNGNVTHGTRYENILTDISVGTTVKSIAVKPGFKTSLTAVTKTE